MGPAILRVQVMSQEPMALDAAPVQQPTGGSVGKGSIQELHPRLQQQLVQVQCDAAGAPNLAQLLPLINAYYEQLDDERRGIVRSMQLIADEARSYGEGLGGVDAGHWQIILDLVKDVVITVGADGAVKIFNPAGERVFGYSRAEIIGQPIARLLPDLALQGSVERGLQALASHPDESREDLRPHEMRARHRDGDVFPAELFVRRVHIDRRDVYVICLRDTSERVRAEQALRDSEARYRTLVESAPELIVVIDVQSGLFVDANENALRFFGVGRERMLKLGPIDVSFPRQAGGAAAGALFSDLCAQAAGKPQVFEWLHRDAHGHEVETEVRLMALPGAGHLLRASITDVAGRRRAERITSGERNVFERIAADASLTEVLESIADLIESISGSFTATIGLLAADGQSFTEIIGRRVPEHWRKLEQRLTVDIRNGSSAAAVYLGRHVLVADIEQDAFWQRRREFALEVGFRAAWAVPIKTSSGRVLGAVSIYRPQVGAPLARDVDLMSHAARLASIAIERRRGEEALRASEAKFRSLYDRMLEGVYQCAADGRMLEVNPAFVKMLGYERAEDVYALRGLSVLCWNPAERAEFECSLQLHAMPSASCAAATARAWWCWRAPASSGTTTGASSPTKARWRTSVSASAPSRQCSRKRNVRR